MPFGDETFGFLLCRAAFMLLKRAYTKSEFEDLIARTKFRGVEIRENLTGLEISLAKDREIS